MILLNIILFLEALLILQGNWKLELQIQIPFLIYSMLKRTN